MPVVHLDDLDVVVVVQQAGDLLGEPEEQVHGKAHVGRLNHRGLRRRCLQGGLLIGAEARGADDQHRALRRRELGVVGGGPRQGEVEHCVGGTEHRLRIVAHRDSQRLDPGERAAVPAERGMLRHLGRGRDGAALGRRHLADQRLAHAPGGARNPDLHGPSGGSFSGVSVAAPQRPSKPPATRCRR